MSHSLTLGNGVLQDVEAGVAGGRFTAAETESGVLTVLGVAQMALARVVAEPARASPLGAQLSGLVLRALGLSSAEAEHIGAEAARDIIGTAGQGPSAAPRGA